MIINVFLLKGERMGKRDDRNNFWNLESRWDFDFRELRKGNPTLTVGKQKNSSIFSVGLLKSLETDNAKYLQYR